MANILHVTLKDMTNWHSLAWPLAQKVVLAKKDILMDCDGMPQ